MQAPNAVGNMSGLTHQTSIISTASQTENNGSHQQQNGNLVNGVSNSSGTRSTRTAMAPNNDGGSWRCEVFVDTPMTRELIQGPLNIQLPPIQLPSGLQNLVGQFTAGADDNGVGQQYPLQRQTSLAIGDGVAAVSSAFHQNIQNQQPQGLEVVQQNSSIVQSPTLPPPPSIPEQSIHVARQNSTRIPGSGGVEQLSPTPSLASNGRANSTPAVTNLTRAQQANRFNVALTPGRNPPDTVIDIDVHRNIGSPSMDNRVHRRRSSSPVRSNSSNSTQNCATAHFGENFGGPSSPQLIQRTVASSTANNNGGGGADRSTTTLGTDRTMSSATTTTGTSSDGETVDGSANASGNNSGGDGEEATFRNLRARFRDLLRRRHQILRNVVQQTGEFPSLYALGVLFSWLIVIIFVLIQFFTIEFTACLSLVFCLFHYSDVVAFKRYISGTGSGWLLTAKIVLRQFMLLQVLGQSQFIFSAAIFQSVATNPLLVPVPTFWSTLYIVFITEYFIMDCLLCAKILVSNMPKCSTMYKRRLYQWLEYSAALYRFSVPFPQWNAYLNAMWWTVLYGGMKILLSLSMAWGWLLTTLRIFRATHLGTKPSEADRQNNETCTICFGEFTSPIKLKCAHIFCSECIRTWLDREHTCPICRAVVTKEDNNYRNGESMFPALF